MNSFLTNTKNDKKSNFYLSKCDLINKYNIKTAYKIPKMDKIVLEFPFEDFMKACTFSEKDQVNPTFQLKGAIIFYIFASLMPYINYNKSTLSLKKKVNSEKGYSLKIIINNKEDVNSLLSTLFVENWSKLISEEFSLFKRLNSKDIDNKIKTTKISIIKASVLGSSFLEIDTFLNKYFLKINSRNLSLKFNFIVYNPIKIKNSTKLIKNIAPFWINK